MKTGAAIQIKVDDREVVSKLGRIAEHLGDLLPAMKIIGEIARTSVVRNFEKSGRPTRWTALSGAWLKRKKGTKILIEQGMAGGLMGSIKPKAFSDRVTIGTNKIYAATHQFGRGGIPARPFMMLQAEDWPEIRAELNDYILGARK